MANIPSSPVPIVQAAAQSTKPVSESLMFAIGGAVNYCLTNSAHVGDVVDSALGLADFQALRDTTWVLMDGATSLVGTDLGNLTGWSVVPDARGTFTKMSDAAAIRDPNGYQPPGTYLADTLASHNHALTPSGANVGTATGSAQAGGDFSAASNPTAGGTAAAGSSETAPKTMYMNRYIKINT